MRFSRRHEGRPPDLLLVLLFLVGVTGLNRNSTANRKMEMKLIDLQLRGGSLTSYKTASLANSPWELGEMKMAEDQEEIGFYRIIGCPLPPRHNESQLWDNLKYLLATEPKLERARKIFVLNRLEPKLESEVRRFIENDYGLETLAMPLDMSEYRPFQMEDTYGLSKKLWDPYLTEKFSRMNARLYVMNNNGARNYALRQGLKRGWAWTLPFDGNCIFTTETWTQFLADLDEAKAAKKAYMAIPLVRTLLDANRSLVRSGVPGEHQVAFNRDAKVQFDPTQPYGHRPKVNLLWRLGIPGVWDNWIRDAPFRAQEPCELANHHECGRTWPKKNSIEANRTAISKTVILRLPDGITQRAVGEDPDALGRRAELRDVGTMRKISQVDDARPTAMVRAFKKPVFFNVVSMESMRRECLATKMLMVPLGTSAAHHPVLSSPSRKKLRLLDHLVIGAYDQHHCSQMEDLQKLAEVHLRDSVYTVVDKAESPAYDPPEGATVQDYQRLGLYDWRVKELPMTINVSDLRIPPVLAGVTTTNLRDPQWRFEHGNVFVGWDGHARNGADIGAEGSEAFDRTRSYDMMSNITMNSLAYFYTGKDEFAEKATRIARTWFVDPNTAQTPNMDYAQFSKRPEKAHFGVIATKDLAYTFDALWLVTPTKFWSDQDDKVLRRWCGDYLQWLDKSNERKSPNNHGWYYLTQYIAVAKCSGKPDSFLVWKMRDHVNTYVREPYITKEGVFTLEAERSRGMHYHFFTFYAIILVWRSLSNLGARDLMVHISNTVRPTLSYLDSVVTNSSSCLSWDEEFQRRRLSSITGCVPHRVALEYAAPVCQWALDDDPDFASTLSMCQRQGDRLAPTPRYQFLGTPNVDNFIMPPFIPTYPHMGYFPFTNLMW